MNRYSFWKPQHQTPKSPANKEMELNSSKLDPRRCGTPFTEGGGKFYNGRMMRNLRHAIMVRASMIKRGEISQSARSVFYGDA